MAEISSVKARVWMSYVNIVNGVDEDFRDMKAHGIEGVEINMYPAIWVGDEIDLNQALACARKYGMQLAFTIENIKTHLADEGVSVRDTW